ncbi:MAG: ATP-binding protein, partial [Candidatus Omnitrophota bacterium]
MKKIISIFITACLFINNTSFALSPAVVSGNLTENAHDYKYLTLAQIALQYTITEISRVPGINKTKDLEAVKTAFEKHEKFKKSFIEYENTHFNRAEITCYCNQVDQVAENTPLFMIPVSVEKNGIREDYRLVFLTVPNVLGGYESALCTIEQFEDMKKTVNTNKEEDFLKSDNRNTRLIEEIKVQYMHNELVIDPFIQDRIKAGDFAEFDSIAEEVDKKYPKREKPAQNLSEKYLQYMKEKLDPFLKILGISFEEAFQDKNFVFIRVPKGVELPPVKRYGKPLDVTSHTSKNSSYKFLSEEKFDILMQQQDLTDDTRKILDDALADIVHEVGAVYRLPLLRLQTRDIGYPIFFEKIANYIDRLYAEYKYSKMRGMPLNEFKTTEKDMTEYVLTAIAKGRANLDHLYVGGVHRDYLSGKDKTVSYQEAVVNDIKGFIDEDKVVLMPEIAKSDGKTISYKTQQITDRGALKGDEIASYNNAYELMNFWIDLNGKLDDVNWLKQKIKEFCDDAEKFAKNERLLSLAFSDLNDETGILTIFNTHFKMLETDSEFIRQLKNKIHFYVLPPQLQQWIVDQYTETAEKKDTQLFKLGSIVSSQILDKVTAILKKVRKIRIVVELDTLHVSPRTKEIACVNPANESIWVGEHYFKNLLAMGPHHLGLFLFNMGQELDHASNTLGFRKIKYVNQETSKKIIDLWEEKIPKSWEPVRSGNNIGKGDRIINVFERLQSFVQNETQKILLIQGSSGSGKNMAVDFIIGELEKEKRPGEVVGVPEVLNCAELTGLSVGELRNEFKYHVDIATETYLGTTGPMVFIIDNLDEADDTLQRQLINFLDRMQNAQRTRPGKVVVVCLAKEPLNSLRQDLKKRLYLDETIHIPDLKDRIYTDEKEENNFHESVLFAEFYNWIESETYGLSKSPLNYDVGYMIMQWCKDKNVQPMEIYQFIQGLVKTREALIKSLNQTGKLPQKSMRGTEIEDEVKNMFSPNIITRADIAYYATPSNILQYADNGNNTMELRGEPYFREFAPRNAKGEKVTFFMRGETVEESDEAEQYPASLNEVSKDLGPDLENSTDSEFHTELDGIMEDIPNEYNFSGVNIDKLEEALTERQFITDEFELMETTNGMEINNFVEHICNKFFRFEENENRIARSEKHLPTQTLCSNGKVLNETSSLDFLIKPKQKKQKYIVSVKFGKDAENKDVIYVETSTTDVKKADADVSVQEKTICKHSQWIDNLKNRKNVQVFLPQFMRLLAPEWLKESVLDKILDFSKMDKKSALIFSEKVTFDNGVGALLPKLAEANIKVGVIATTEKQKKVVEYLNSIVLEKTENKIFCAETVSELVSEMKNDTPRFYYFKIDADREEDLPDNVTLIDKLTV